MKAVIRFGATEELKALPILLRHSPGMMLRNRVYILDEEAVRTVREAGIKFTEITREAVVARRGAKGAAAGERI